MWAKVRALKEQGVMPIVGQIESIYGNTWADERASGGGETLQGPLGSIELGYFDGCYTCTVTVIVNSDIPHSMSWLAHRTTSITME